MRCGDDVNQSQDGAEPEHAQLNWKHRILHMRLQREPSGCTEANECDLTPRASVQGHGLVDNRFSAGTSGDLSMNRCRTVAVNESACDPAGKSFVDEARDFNSQYGHPCEPSLWPSGCCRKSVVSHTRQAATLEGLTRERNVVALHRRRTRESPATAAQICAAQVGGRWHPKGFTARHVARTGISYAGIRQVARALIGRGQSDSQRPRLIEFPGPAPGTQVPCS